MESAFPISTNYFHYKYVTLYKKQILIWENGINRIADLSVLPEAGDNFKVLNIEESPVYIN